MNKNRIFLRVTIMLSSVYLLGFTLEESNEEKKWFASEWWNQHKITALHEQKGWAGKDI